MQKVKPFAPYFDCYVERLDCPPAPQHPHRGRDGTVRGLALQGGQGLAASIQNDSGLPKDLFPPSVVG
jgi:hypothetical protein